MAFRINRRRQAADFTRLPPIRLLAPSASTQHGELVTSHDFLTLVLKRP